MTAEPVLIARDIARHYHLGTVLSDSGTLKAVDGVSFTVAAGETLAVVGESGCGKSTLGRVVTMIELPSNGTLTIDGRDATLKTNARSLRSAVQMVFQNPYGSLNPRKTVGSILEEPLVINSPLTRAERRERARDMMARVGLRPEHYSRYPHMFSGGQRQRIAIARALMLRPKIIVADEPVSALDISVQAQVLNLLAELQSEFGQAYVFISHDLSVVRHVADEIMVMYLGRAAEHGPRDEVLDRPRHPYTRALIASTPSVDPARRQERQVLGGEPPSPMDPPPGCTFHRRCPFATDRCRTERPELRPLGQTHVACHHSEQISI